MNRKEFLSKSIKLGFCSSALFALNLDALAENSSTPDEKLEHLQAEKDFIVNWLTDLLDTMDKSLDYEAKARLIAGCGRGCFDRHEFKKEIAAKGKGDLDKLLQAYKQNFEAWVDGKEFHIRFGETSDICYCPVARNIPAKPNDVHCECTLATHRAIFESAFGHPFSARIVESLRRGGKTCHFVILLA